MTFFMNELSLTYKGLGDAFFPSIFSLWKMMTVFIARHITVRTHEADGQGCFPRSPSPAASSACRVPEIAALVKACIGMSQSRWQMAGDCCGYTAGTE